MAFKRKFLWTLLNLFRQLILRDHQHINQLGR